MIRPRLISHIFDSESKTATFGWSLKITSTLLYLFVPTFGADRWERCIIVAALLIGGKLAKEMLLDHAEITKGKPDEKPAQP